MPCVPPQNNYRTVPYYTKRIPSSTEFPLNSSQLMTLFTQWAFHIGLVQHMFSVVLRWVSRPSGVVPCVVKAESLCSFPSFLCLLLEPVPTALFLLLFELMFPSTGWLVILAFASTNSSISPIVLADFAPRNYCIPFLLSRPLLTQFPAGNSLSSVLTTVLLIEYPAGSSRELLPLTRQLS